jgi:uncharacterized spore protein YtfJ
MITRFFQSIGEKIQGQTSISKVYGEPIETQGKTLIPVAKVTFGYGVGVGNVANSEDETNASHQTGAGGVGGGGGAVVTPIGILEITKENTRFIPIDDRKKWFQIFIAGFTTALFLRRLLKK